MRAFTVVDAAIMIAMACGAFLTYRSIGSEKPDSVVVFKQNSIVAEYPLGDDVAFSIDGQIGMIDIEIKNRSARVLHVDCPRQVCKRSGAINGPHGRIICAPNNVLIMIRPSINNNLSNGNVDGVAY